MTGPAGGSAGGALPLEGITVVALEQSAAAPLATRHLADQGPRVIKIERPGRGDVARHYDGAVLGQAAHFVWRNRGKESVALDAESDASRAPLRRLIAQADEFVHNLGPGAAARLGLAPLAEAGIAAARRRIVPEVAEHPHIVQRDRVRRVGTPAGPVEAVLPPIDLDGAEAAMGDVPALGQHTRTVLGRRGLRRRKWTR